MRTVDIGDAKKRLSQLIDQVAKGEPLVITKAGNPLVMISPLDSPTSKRTQRLGFLAGQFQVPDDFDRMGTEIKRRFNNAG